MQSKTGTEFIFLEKEGINVAAVLTLLSLPRPTREKTSHRKHEERPAGREPAVSRPTTRLDWPRYKAP